MTPDPKREWYVYFQEKEMGPFLELDLQKKIAKGELDQTAFVFTEGLSDWTAMDELEFLSETLVGVQPVIIKPMESEGLQEVQIPELRPEILSQTVTSRGMSVEKLGVDEETDFEKRVSAAQTKPANHRKSQILRWVMISFVMLLVLGVGVDYLNMAPTMKQNLLSKFGLADSKKVEPNDVPVAPPMDVTQPQQGLSLKESKIWEELNLFRASQDVQTPTFRIASSVLSENRPIVVGALSSFFDTPRVHIVVYPDLSRSLMADPMIWWFDPILVDGYFVIGPLNVDGAPLPLGTYKLVLQGMGKFLGMVTFDVGQFPLGPELDVQMKLMQNQRALAAQQEQKILDRLYSEFDILYETLKSDALRLALKENSQRAAWDRSMKIWTEGFDKSSRELNQMRGLSYFKNVQDKMENFSKEMLKVQGLMDLYNKSGRAAFEKRAGRRYSELWASLQNERDFLKSDLQSLATQTEYSPTIDEELLKVRLLERK